MFRKFLRPILEQIKHQKGKKRQRFYGTWLRRIRAKTRRSKRVDYEDRPNNIQYQIVKLDEKNAD